MRLSPMLENARLFDPEMVGYLLMEVLKDHEFSDFQELPPWRALVPAVTSAIAEFTGQHLVATQSVLTESYWKELQRGFDRLSLDVFHVLLHADPEMLARRILADQEELTARQWRLDHISQYLGAREWMQSAADLVVDSTNLRAEEVAVAIRTAVLARS
jgi:hypothetical protein